MAAQAHEDEIAKWIESLRGLYGPKRAKDFDKERHFLKSYFHELIERAGEDFRFTRPLKVGGSGVVFGLTRVSFSQDAVLKFNRPNIRVDEESMVERESSVLPLFNHANIIPIIDCGAVNLQDGTPSLHYIIEPLIADAMTLDEFFRSRGDEIHSS